MRLRGPLIACAAAALAVLPIPAAAGTHAPKAIAVGQVIEWSLAKGGYGATYRAGGLAVRLTLTPIPTKVEAADLGAVSGDVARTPVMTVSAAGRAPIRVAGVEGSSAGTTWFAVGKLDQKAPGNQVIFASFSFGAHCCTKYQVIEADTKGRGWMVLDLGDFDGDPLPEFPRDVDGDGVREFVFWDNGFNYAFCGYACSAPYAPPLVLEVRDGRVRDTSRAARLRPLFERNLKDLQEECVTDGGNGACAGFVATAARLGRREWAWKFLGSDRPSEEQAGLLGGCNAHYLKQVCPKGHEVEFNSFQRSLEAFLVRLGYMKASDARFPSSIPPDPSFACDRRLNAVEQLICDTRPLRIADLDLAYAMGGALANSADAEALEREQALWLGRRDAVGPDVQALLAVYADRIRALEAPVSRP